MQLMHPAAFPPSFIPVPRRNSPKSRSLERATGSGPPIKFFLDTICAAFLPLIDRSVRPSACKSSIFRYGFPSNKKDRLRRFKSTIFGVQLFQSLSLEAAFRRNCGRFGKKALTMLIKRKELVWAALGLFCGNLEIVEYLNAMVKHKLVYDQ